MKNSIKIIVLILLFTAAQGCTDLLQKVEPSTSTTQEIALGTPAGVKSIRSSMYSNLFSFAYNTAYMIAPSSLADGLFYSAGAGRFKGKNLNEQANTVGFWGSSYNMIQSANLLIGAVPEGVIPPDLLKQYKGEAYFLRAFAEHNLARAYSYEPNSNPPSGQGADFNLGIVIRTKPVLSVEDVKYKGRATIEETYQQIESDLLKAIDLLSQGDAGMVRYASQAAAEALLARVYLYWKKWEKADQYAQSALQHTDAELAAPSDLGALFFNSGTTTEVIFRAYVGSNAANAVNDPLNSGKTAYTSNQYVAQVPTQDLMNLYSSNDARLVWFQPCYDENSSTTPQCRGTHPSISSDGDKQGLELEKWNGDYFTNLSDNIPFFRVPEMYFIMAEARLKGASGSASEPLNKVRNSRGLSDYTGSDVMQAVIDGRRREYVGEGQRFWDLKRWGKDIRKAPETLVFPGVNVVQYTNFRVLNRIPIDVVALSQQNAPEGEVIQQNPGY